MLLSLLPVPRPLVRPLGVLAAASLHVHLVQFQVFAFFDTPIVQFIAAGLVFCAVSTCALRRLPYPAGRTPIRRPGTAMHPVRED